MLDCLYEAGWWVRQGDDAVNLRFTGSNPLS
jgi:hypothetical protein